MNSEEALTHFGVKGMRWGVRKSGSSGSSKTPRTPAQQAKVDAYFNVGKQVAKAVLITAGTIGVSMVAGPIVAAGAGAAARALTANGVIGVETHTRTLTDDFGVPSEAAAESFFKGPRH